MGVVAFDTLRCARRLIAAGMPQQQAEAQAEVMAEAFIYNADSLVTKDYLDARLDARITEQDARIDRRFAGVDQQFAGIEGRFVEMKAYMDVRFTDMQSQMDVRFSDMQSQMDVRFSESEGRMNTRFAKFDGQFRLIFWMFCVLLGSTVLPALPEIYSIVRNWI